MTKLKKDIFTAYISQFLILSSSTLFFLIISNQLSVEDYGLYQRYNSWILISAFLLSFGFESILLRFSPSLHENKNYEFNFFTLQFLIVRVIIIFTFSLLISMFLNISTFGFEIMLMLILLLSQIRTLICHYLLSTTNLLFERVINAGLSMLKFVFVIIFLNQLNVKLIFYIILISEIIILFTYSLKLIISKAYIIKITKIQNKSEIIKFGYQNYLNRIVNNLYEIPFFVILIDLFNLGLTELSFFAFSYVILNILYTLNLFTLLEQHLIVYLKNTYKKNINEFEKKLNLLSRSSLIIQFFVLIFSISFIKDILYIIYEDKFMESIKYFEIGVILIFTKSINSTFAPFVYLEKKIKLQNKLSLIHFCLLPGVVIFMSSFSIIGVFYFLILFYLILILYQTNYSHKVFNYRAWGITQMIFLLFLFIFFSIYCMNINNYNLLQKLQFIILFYIAASFSVVRSNFLNLNEIKFIFKNILNSNKI